MVLLLRRLCRKGKGERMIAPCPTSGTGVHYWILGAANKLRHSGLTESEVATAIKTRMTRQPKPPSEVETAVEKAFADIGQTSTTSARVAVKSKPKKMEWPEPIDFHALPYDAEAFTLDDLEAASPIIFDDGCPHSDGVVAALFGVDRLIFIRVRNPAGAGYKCVTAMYQQLPPMDSWEFIVPSSMSKPTGTTKDGKPNRPRTEDNVGPRMFLICEMDGETYNHQAAALKYLSQFAPLVMVVDSSGKSLHGWFHVERRGEQWCRKFFELCVSLGADTAPWSRVQLVRMPDGIRSKTGKRQSIVYYDPLNVAANDIFRRGGRTL